MGAALIGVLGVVVGSIIGLVAVWLTARYAEGVQERAERRQRRGERLEVLADLLLVLDRTRPFLLEGLRSRENLDEVFAEFSDRCAPVWRMLATIAISDPDPSLRALAGDLRLATEQSLRHTYLLALAVQRRTDPQDASALQGLDVVARESSDRARELHEQLATAVRG
ncbi:hypothetical protein [Frankia sp. R43]|uniref:hypothetical protein n=1 Tax=Frankia sp. R43 TaxID=269536 RepID=UPI00128ED3AE|nr:hypothetical protein [Frankia sp. R43]